MNGITLMALQTGQVKDLLTGSVSERIVQALKYSVVGMLIVMIALVIIALFIKLLSLTSSRAKDGEVKEDKEPGAAKPADVGSPLPETRSRGEVKLVDTSEETAAVIMAIVSDNTGIPLNRLDFVSIKLTEEK